MYMDGNRLPIWHPTRTTCWHTRFALWYTPAMIRRQLYLMAVLCSAIIIGLSGCATGTPDQPVPDQVFVDSMTVPLDFEAAWQLTRDTLLDEDVEIYSRDKRGLFIAYTKTKRKSLIVPWRTKITVSLQEETPETTKIAVETVAQRYTVTFLTYPSWRDKDFSDEEALGTALLESIKSRIVQN